jgi:hypothetical protein
VSDLFPGPEGGSLPAGFEPGSVIAGYRLEKKIGSGGMAMVFLARDERLQRQVALKVLAPTLASDDSFRLRFIQESQAAAAVDDPHIIPVFEAGEGLAGQRRQPAVARPVRRLRPARGGERGGLRGQPGPEAHRVPRGQRDPAVEPPGRPPDHPGGQRSGGLRR